MNMEYNGGHINPLSGRYYGVSTSGKYGGSGLDLRVDVDPIGNNSPVMNRISGDFFKVSSLRLPGGVSKDWRMYEESWMVDNPKLSRIKGAVKIAGDVRFWRGAHSPTRVKLVIPLSADGIGPIDVSFAEGGREIATYNCKKISNYFRDLGLEVDICKSMNFEPTSPSYDTCTHTMHPPGLGQRMMTFGSAYQDAGVSVTIHDSDRTIIDDSDPSFMHWTAEELHHAMEQYFCRYPGGWPKWDMWGIIARGFNISSVLGVMFDYGTAPQRQGFAIFRKHRLFDYLVSGKPTTEAQAAAMREFLFTWVHEAGHAFNLMHSFDKSRPNALSWMNYPEKYDELNGPNSFWGNFMMRFDDDELIHIRHGDLMSVIMGGDESGSGNFREVHPSIMSPMDGEAPVDVLIRSKEYFELLEPVVVELRVKNLLDEPVLIEANLKPEYGSTKFYVRRPDGRVMECRPVICQMATPNIKTLEPKDSNIEGGDRHSDTIFLSYGSIGFNFDKPGDYLIRAIYQGPGGRMLPSNVHRVRIGNPKTNEEDALGLKFFTYQTGMDMYLKGSRSCFLSEGLKVLNEIAEIYQDKIVGAKIATGISTSLGRPFFIVDKGILRLDQPAEPMQALELTEPAVNVFRNLKDKDAERQNITYRKLIENRVRLHKDVGEKSKAKEELSLLHNDLADRGVNELVLNDISAEMENL